MGVNNSGTLNDCATCVGLGITPIPGKQRHSPLTPLIYHLYPIWGTVIFFSTSSLFPISSVSPSLEFLLLFCLFFSPTEAINGAALSRSPWTGGELLQNAASLSTLSHRSPGSPGGRLCANMQMRLCPSNDSGGRIHPSIWWRLRDEVQAPPKPPPPDNP